MHLQALIFSSFIITMVWLYIRNQSRAQKLSRKFVTIDYTSISVYKIFFYKPYSFKTIMKSLKFGIQVWCAYSFNGSLVEIILTILTSAC